MVAHPEWNPSKWDPTAESDTDSYEEILVETNPGDLAMQAQPLIIQKLKTQQEKPDRQNLDQLPPLLMYMHTPASCRVSLQVSPEADRVCYGVSAEAGRHCGPGGTGGICPALEPWAVVGGACEKINLALLHSNSSLGMLHLTEKQSFFVNCIIIISITMSL